MRKIWTGAAALSALLGAPGAMAQQGGAQTPSEEIVVTVQKREQALKDVPMAVTAYSGSFLDRTGVQKFDELAVLVPGLEIQEQSPNNPGFVVRGITSDSGEATVEPRVAVFQDGVSISKSRGSYVELFDLERVEIAKGPQATLFGRGALIGGIDLIQAKPTLNGVGGKIELSAGDFGQRRAFGMVQSAILEDQLGVRLAATIRERDGFTQNTLGEPRLGGGETKAVRASVRAQPLENLRFDLIANRQDDSATGTAFKSGTFAPIGGDTSPFSAAALSTFGGFEGGRSLGLERRVDAVTLLGRWDISDALRLSSTSGFRTFDSFEVFDPDGARFPILVFGEEATGRQWSQDLRLNFEASERFSFFVGASYQYENGSQRVPLGFGESQTLALFLGQVPALNAGLVSTGQLVQGFLASNRRFNPATGASAAAPILLSTAQANALAANFRNYTEVFANSQETTSWDVYGDATFKVTDKLEVSAGLRWTFDDKTAGFQATQPNGRSVLGALLAFEGLDNALPGAAAGQPLAVQTAAMGQVVAQQTALLGALQVPGAALIPTSVAFPVPATGLFVQPTAGGGVDRSSKTFDGGAWRLVARYAVSDALSLWGSYARGRRPETFSIGAPSTPGGATTFNVLPAEIVDSFEIGAKASLLGGKLGLDGSVCQYSYSDFQTSEFVNGRLVNINAGDAKATGFEGSANWRASEAVELFATYAYNRGRFETGARNGNQFRLSPDHSLSLGATLDFAVGDLGRVSITPLYTWQSEVFFDDDNDKANLQNQRLSPLFNDTRVDEDQDSYGLFNLRAQFDRTDAGWAVGLYVKNALDEEYIIDAGNTGDSFGIPTFIRGAPRTFGMELKANF